MEKIEYSNRIVAFVDILGFKKIISESEYDSSKLEIIYKSLEYLKNKEKSGEWDLSLIEIEEDAQKIGVASFDISKTVSCTCFSDSIIVSAEYDNENINEVTSTLTANLAYIGAKLMMEGIIIRGAITLGKLIHNNDGVIMGQALIEAHDLEHKAAKYPRVILSNKLISKLNYPLSYKRDRYPYHQYLNRFDDGCVGFHQMTYFQVVQSWTEMKDDRLTAELKLIKQTVIDGLDSSFELPDVHEKFIWLKNEYSKLIILDEGVKEKLHDLNENTGNHNIHYSTTDKIHYPKEILSTIE